MEDVLHYLIRIIRDINPFLGLYLTILSLGIGTWQDIEVSITKYLTFQSMHPLFTTVGMSKYKDAKLILAST
jgi:hypothetical protein